MKSGWSAVCSMKGPVDALNYLMNILKLTSSSSCDITIIWKFGKYSFKSLTSEHNISIIYIMLYFRDNVPERGEVAEQSEKKNRGWTRAWERKCFCRSVSHLTNGAVKRLAWECAETHNNNPAQRRQGNQGPADENYRSPFMSSLPDVAPKSDLKCNFDTGQNIIFQVRISFQRAVLLVNVFVHVHSK